MAHARPTGPKAALSEDAKGAHANAVGYALGPDEFKQRVKDALAMHDLELIEIEDVETFEDRSDHYEVSDELSAPAASVQPNDDPRFDYFYEYFGDDEIN